MVFLPVHFLRRIAQRYAIDMFYKSPSFIRPNPSASWVREYNRMALNLPELKEVERVSSSVMRILGGNPSKVGSPAQAVVRDES